MYANNGNCTEWRAICSEIIRLIRRARSAITSMILDQNCTLQSSITTLLVTLKSQNSVTANIFIDQVGSLLKSGNKQTFTSHFVR